MHDIDFSTREILFHSIMANSYARIEIIGTEFVPIGNVTDAAMLTFMQKHAINPKAQMEEIVQLDFIPFTLDDKISSSIVEHPKSSDVARIYTKGAPEFVIQKCTCIIDKSGDVV